MNDSRFLRQLLVALLVTWSPGSWWCCCGTRDEAPAQAVATDGQATSCCSGRELAAPTVLDVASECCPLDADEAPSCGCLHGAIDAALPAVVTTPPAGDSNGADLDLLAELAPAIAVVATRAHASSMCRGSPPPVPAQTLLALHTLLTT